MHDALEAGKVAHAMELAKRLPFPWYRCQALAAVASNVKEAAPRKQLLDAAFEAALQTEEPNRIVTVSAWPLAVLADFGESKRVKQETQRLLAIIGKEPHPVRRMDALSMLHSRVRCESVSSLLDREVLRAALEGHGWKRDALLAGRASVAALEGDRSQALSLLESIEIPRSRRKAARDLAELGLDVPGVDLPNLEMRRRARAELVAFGKEAALVHAQWVAATNPNRDPDLVSRMTGLRKRERELTGELQRARKARSPQQSDAPP